MEKYEHFSLKKSSGNKVETVMEFFIFQLRPRFNENTITNPQGILFLSVLFLPL